VSEICTLLCAVPAVAVSTNVALPPCTTGDVVSCFFNTIGPVVAVAVLLHTTVGMYDADMKRRS